MQDWIAKALTAIAALSGWVLLALAIALAVVLFSPAAIRETASSLNPRENIRDLFSGISSSFRNCPSFFCLNPGVHSNTVPGIAKVEYTRPTSTFPKERLT